MKHQHKHRNACPDLLCAFLPPTLAFLANIVVSFYYIYHVFLFLKASAFCCVMHVFSALNKLYCMTLNMSIKTVHLKAVPNQTASRLHFLNDFDSCVFPLQDTRRQCNESL